MSLANATNPYAPGETAATIYAEETWLQGNLLSNIAYGAELVLFVMCAHVLTQQISRFHRTREMVLLAFVSVIFTLGTLFMGAQAKFTQQAFIENRNFPGGPAAYEEVMYSDPVDEIANVCFIVGNWLMDGFLVWRFMVIYMDFGRSWLVILMALPCMMLCCSVGLGITFLVQTSASSPFVDVNMTLAYYVMSLALNVIVTIFITGRLMFYRHRVKRALGVTHVSTYANAAAIFIESAMLYAVFAILFLVPFGLNNALGNVFLQTVSQVQTVSSLMIVYRIAQGQAWTEKTNVEALTSGINLQQLATMQTSKDPNTRPESIASKDDGSTAATSERRPNVSEMV